jgi:Fanconi-associated nuclease 1
MNMSLRGKGMANHDAMLGRRVSHETQAKISRDEGPPPPKRFKTMESIDTDEGSALGDSDSGRPEITRQVFKDEIPDSEEDQDGDDEPRFASHRPTELENALPPVKADKEAIEEYESMRATAQDSPNGLLNRLDAGTWTRGKSSIYVDAFNLALETVLEEESHLFDEAETAVFDQWKALGYETQYLSVALFLCRNVLTLH